MRSRKTSVKSNQHGALQQADWKRKERVMKGARLQPSPILPCMHAPYESACVPLVTDLTTRSPGLAERVLPAKNTQDAHVMHDLACANEELFKNRSAIDTRMRQREYV